MLLTEKNNGDVKGRAMFNGKQSHVWTTKEDIFSPTVDNESIMITVEIDAKEGRDVTVVNITNTFIQTKTTHKEKGDRMIMKMTGALFDMLLKLDPDKFKGYTVCEK